MYKWGKISRADLRFVVMVAALTVAIPMHPTKAQFVCADAAGDTQGATATGIRALACGPVAQAVGDNSTAVGDSASASGAGATAIGRNAEARADGATAIGNEALATAEGATATGNFSGAFGVGATATGSNAIASSDGATAIGSFSQAEGKDSTAVGANSSAKFTNSAAFGAGATATRENQQVFGTSSNTYTMAGIASSASRAAQQGRIEVVTTDLNGNLASDGGAFQARIDAMGKRDRELAEGISISLAIQQPIFHSGQSFAFRMGYGNFDGSNALGLSAAGILDRGSFGKTSSVTLDGGIGFGTDTGTVATRAGLTIGW